MFSQTHYLLRSKADGQYVAAHPSGKADKTGYLLTFSEHFDALSYLNTHGADIINHFGVESVSKTQLQGILQRWGFQGIGLVKDPLLPQIEFFSYGEKS